MKDIFSILGTFLLMISSLYASDTIPDNDFIPAPSLYSLAKAQVVRMINNNSNSGPLKLTIESMPQEVALDVLMEISKHKLTSLAGAKEVKLAEENSAKECALEALRQLPYEPNPCVSYKKIRTYLQKYRPNSVSLYFVKSSGLQIELNKNLSWLAYSNLECLSLTGANLTDNLVLELNKLTGLRNLSLEFAANGATHSLDFSKMPLRSLCVRKLELSSGSINSIPTYLQSLQLPNQSFTPELWKVLAELKGLNSLEIDVRAGMEEMPKLKQPLNNLLYLSLTNMGRAFKFHDSIGLNFPNLEGLFLTEFRFVSGQSEAIVSLPKLHSLKIKQGYFETLESFNLLGECKALKELVLDKCTGGNSYIFMNKIINLAKRLASLKSLSVSGIKFGKSRESYEEFSALPLRQFEFRGANAPVSFFKCVSLNTTLRSLKLNGCSKYSKVLQHIIPMPLVQLSIAKMRVTNNDIKLISINTSLRSLSLAPSKNLTDMMAMGLSLCRHLRTLDLSKAYLSRGAVSILREITTLDQLYLGELE